MAKRKIIKRVYEKGRERVVTAPKKRAVSKSRLKTVNKVKEIKRGFDSGAKVSASQVQKRDYAFVDNYDIPQSYQKTSLRLLVKDPFWVFAYWETTSADAQGLKNSIPEDKRESAKFILRMYDVTLVDFNGTNANYFFDIEVGEFSNNWYINLQHDAASFVGQLGFQTWDGSFYCLAQSNFVQTPRMSYSHRSEHIWMKVDERENKSAFVNTAKASLRKKDFGLGFSQIAQKGRRKRFFVTEDEIRLYYSKLSPLLKDIISGRLNVYYGKRARKYLEGDTDFERHRILSRLPKGYFIRKIILGSSQDLVILGKEQAAQVAEAASGASDFVAEKVKPKDFFFELNAELIVYGRTEADAEVFLGDKKIKLNQDGTFSLRFTLPDGNIPLEFKAVKSDKSQKRHINTYVNRNTNYEQRPK